MSTGANVHTLVARASTMVAMCLIAIGAGAATATAQTSFPSRLIVGLVGGAAAVEHVGGLAGINVSVGGPSRVSLFGEATWLQDVVTRRRVETTNSIAGYLSQTQGRQATSTIDAPAAVLTGGARISFSQSGALRPYVAVQAGVARVTLRPSFTLAGADVTANLAQYGVTLGEDLTGSTTQPAFGGGFGVVAGSGAWTLDVGLRFLSLRAKNQPAGVSQLAIGIAREF